MTCSRPSTLTNTKWIWGELRQLLRCRPPRTSPLLPTPPGGYVVYARGGPLTGPRVVTDVPGSNGSPAPFNSGERFGYTLDAVRVPRFAGSLFSAISTTNAPVMTYAAGAPALETTSCIAFQLAVTASTAAGFYSTTVTYTVVPTF